MTDKTSYPVKISVLGLDAVVPLTNFIAYGFQKFRFHCVYSTMTVYIYSIECDCNVNVILTYFFRCDVGEIVVCF